MLTAGQNTSTGTITILGVAFIAIVTLLLSQERFSLLQALVGVILLFLLLEYSGAARSRAERWATGAVFGLCTVLILGWLLSPIYNLLGWDRGFSAPGPTLQFTSWEVFLVLIWLIATLIWRKVRS